MFRIRTEGVSCGHGTTQLSIKDGECLGRDSWKEKGFIGPCFWRFQSGIQWPDCFPACVKPYIMVHSKVAHLDPRKCYLCHLLESQCHPHSTLGSKHLPHGPWGDAEDSNHSKQHSPPRVIGAYQSFLATWGNNCKITFLPLWQCFVWCKWTCLYYLLKFKKSEVGIFLQEDGEHI